MKKTKLLLKKLEETIMIVGYFLVDFYGFLRSFFIYSFQTIKKPGIFYGCGSYYWSCKYAEKRSKRWKPFWDQMGRKQGTFPFDDTKLIVCSQMELKMIKKRGGIDKKAKPRKMIKKSYYSTKN